MKVEIGSTAATGCTITLPLKQCWHSLHQVLMPLVMLSQMTHAAGPRQARYQGRASSRKSWNTFWRWENGMNVLGCCWLVSHMTLTLLNGTSLSPSDSSPALCTAGHVCWPAAKAR